MLGHAFEAILARLHLEPCRVLAEARGPRDRSGSVVLQEGLDQGVVGVLRGEVGVDTLDHRQGALPYDLGHLDRSDFLPDRLRHKVVPEGLGVDGLAPAQVPDHLGHSVGSAGLVGAGPAVVAKAQEAPLGPARPGLGPGSLDVAFQLAGRLASDRDVPLAGAQALHQEDGAARPHQQGQAAQLVKSPGGILAWARSWTSRG